MAISGSVRLMAQGRSLTSEQLQWPGSRFLSAACARTFCRRRKTCRRSLGQFGYNLMGIIARSDVRLAVANSLKVRVMAKGHRSSECAIFDRSIRLTPLCPSAKLRNRTKSRA
jgi:hypothetical protein